MRSRLRSSSPSREASGEERSLRARRGASATRGRAGDGIREGEGEARGRSECERARGVAARLAGVTSLRERRWTRRRAPLGESVSVTLMLMLCGAGTVASPVTSRAPAPGLPVPLAFEEFLLGPALLDPAPAS